MIIGVFKSTRMKWPEHVSSMGKKRNTYRILVKKMKERNHLEKLDVDERIIKKEMLKK
jgi:hypothetical protein